MRLYKILGFFVVSFTLTASCSDLKHGALLDPDKNLGRKDYLDMHSPKSSPTAAPIAGEPPIPDIKIDVAGCHNLSVII